MRSKGAARLHRDASAGLHDLLFAATEDRHTGQHTLKLSQRLADGDAFSRRQFEFADGSFVMSTALLKHRDRLFHFPIRFKVAQAYDRVRKITKVHRRFGGGDQSVLGQNKQSDDALLIKIGTRVRAVGYSDTSRRAWH